MWTEHADETASDKAKQTIRDKCNKYLERAEAIKKCLENKSDKKPVKDGEGGADDDKDSESNKMKEKLSGLLIEILFLVVFFSFFSFWRKISKKREKKKETNTI